MISIPTLLLMVYQSLEIILFYTFNKKLGQFTAHFHLSETILSFAHCGKRVLVEHFRGLTWSTKPTKLTSELWSSCSFLITSAKDLKGLRMKTYELPVDLYWSWQENRRICTRERFQSKLGLYSDITRHYWFKLVLTRIYLGWLAFKVDQTGSIQTFLE